MIASFLRKVLPDGLIVVATPAGKGFRHEVCNTVEDAAKWALEFDGKGKDARRSDGHRGIESSGGFL